MSDLKKIGNRRILSALADSLKVEGVEQRAPIHLDTSRLVPTVSLDPGMMAGEQVQINTGLIAIGGLVRWTWAGIGPNTIPSAPAALEAAPGGSYRLPDREIVLLNMRVTISWPVVLGRFLPIPAEVGSCMELSVFRQAAGSPISVVKADSFRPVHYADTARGQYIWSFPMWISAQWQGTDPPSMIQPPPIMAASPIYIPASSFWGLEMDYWNNDGFQDLRAFPAGTFLEIGALLSTCPRGMRPPGM